jgi:hypothetical protein
MLLRLLLLRAITSSSSSCIHIHSLASSTLGLDCCSAWRGLLLLLHGHAC